MSQVEILKHLTRLKKPVNTMRLKKIFKTNAHTIHRKLSQLEKYGFIKKVLIKNKFGQKVNCYVAK